MAHVKTAISLEESLLREADEWAEKLGFSRSQLFAKAVAEFIREQENQELLKRLNEAHAGGLDPEEEELLERMRVYHGRLLEETGNEWKTGG